MQLKKSCIFFSFLLCAVSLMASEEQNCTQIAQNPTAIEATSDNSSKNYHFIGKHLIASYKGCDKQALTNLPKLREALINSANASGATILNESEFVFPPDGLTMVLLLSESHASIHTYPEYDACFVDLFTCGTSCSQEKFNEVMQSYLKPQESSIEIIERK